MPFQTKLTVCMWLAAGALLALRPGSAPLARHVAAAGQSPAVTALPGYRISIFARGTAAYSHPDPILVSGSSVYVAFANLAAKDGSDQKTSTIVRYSLQGQVVRTFSAPGHIDGLRIDPATGLLWALTNEDARPHLETIDPASGTSTLYSFPQPPHGGGYDDLAFTGGKAFIDASNPSLGKSGANTAPALDTITLGNGSVQLTSVLAGNAVASDALSKQKVTLNLVDPDSLTIDSQGDLVLDNQANANLLFIHRPGTPQQQIRSLTVGTQVDDTVWAPTTASRLLVTDTAANTIYAVDAAFRPGTAFSASPNDSGVAGFIGTLDLKKGIITPVIIGIQSPHGMVFVPLH